MALLTKNEFIQIVNNKTAKILKLHDTLQVPKVIQCQENEIIKIFYPKTKLITSNRFFPRAKRFYQNAKRLSLLGFNVPIIQHLDYCPELKIHILGYQKVKGIEVREYLNQKKNTHNLLRDVMIFVSELHHKGIFFRSIHLGNLIWSGKEFALIDITDVRFKNKPLNLFLRYRNLKHLILNRDDYKSWHNFSVDEVMGWYFKAANLSRFAEMLLSLQLKRLIATTKAATT